MSRDLLALTAEIVTSHVGHNDVAAEELPLLIRAVRQALTNTTNPPAPAPAETPLPAVSIR